MTVLLLFVLLLLYWPSFMERLEAQEEPWRPPWEPDETDWYRWHSDR